MPKSYYVNHRQYVGSYTRTTNSKYVTRSSRRMHDGLNLNMNYGLDTQTDDLNSSPYSSPYYINGRFNVDSASVNQRGNSASVQGIKKLLSIYDTNDDVTTALLSDSPDSLTETTIEMWQGKQIKFVVPYEGKIVANTIRLKNTGGCTGALSIYLSDSNNGVPLAETVVDLCDISEDKFDTVTLFPASVIAARANPLGKIYVRLEIWDEISNEKSVNPFNTGRKIEIAATGHGDHESWTYHLGEKNLPVREKIEYHNHPSRPLIGFTYNDFVSVPVDRLANEKVGATVSDKGYRYDIFCVKDGTHAEVLIYDVEMNRIIDSSIRVDARVEQLNIAQVVDTSRTNWVYYVDGYSPLQRFKIGEWVSEALDAGDGSDSSNPKPVLGAALIMHHNNRLYLGHFRKDPNLWQISAIDQNGPDYTTFPYRIYTPNSSPYAFSTNPAIAVVEASSDQIMILGRSFYSLFQSNVNIEDGTPKQVSSYTDSAGVEGQGDVVNYKGIIYSFNRSEGLRRFTGSVWNKLPASVDTHYDRVDMDKPRKLWGHANKLYYNYTDVVDGKRKCLVWDMNMNYQQYPWFQDSDIPFCDVRFDPDGSLIGIHPDYPCIMHHYAEETWKRLDSPIIFERHTKYISLPGNAADMIVQRVHNKVLANSNRWWWFSLAYDLPTLEPRRGTDEWYRMPCWDTVTDEEPPETPFPIQDVYEKDALVQLTLSELHIRCLSIQEKIKVKTFRAQANLISTLFESGARQFN